MISSYLSVYIGNLGKDLKNALNELSRAATLEQEQLEERMNHVILNSNDLRSSLRNTESQLDESKERLRSLQVEYETARADAEGMLKVMNGMEKQLSEYAEREEQVVALSKESKNVLKQRCSNAIKLLLGKFNQGKKLHVYWSNVRI